MEGTATKHSQPGPIQDLSFKLESRERIVSSILDSFLIKDYTVLDVCSVRVTWDSNLHMILYTVTEPLISVSETEHYENSVNALLDKLGGMPPPKKINTAKNTIHSLITEYFLENSVSMGSDVASRFTYFIIRDIIGLGKFEVVLADPHISGAYVLGPDKPLIVQHKIFGELYTNFFMTPEEADHVVEKIKKYVRLDEGTEFAGIMPNGLPVRVVKENDFNQIMIGTSAQKPGDDEINIEESQFDVEPPIEPDDTPIPNLPEIIEARTSQDDIRDLIEGLKDEIKSAFEDISKKEDDLSKEEAEVEEEKPSKDEIQDSALAMFAALRELIQKDLEQRFNDERNKMQEALAAKPPPLPDTSFGEDFKDSSIIGDQKEEPKDKERPSKEDLEKDHSTSQEKSQDDSIVQDAAGTGTAGHGGSGPGGGPDDSAGSGELGGGSGGSGGSGGPSSDMDTRMSEMVAGSLSIEAKEGSSHDEIDMERQRLRMESKASERSYVHLIDMKVPLMGKFAYARIKWDDDKKELVYNVVEPKLKKEEREIYERIRENLYNSLALSTKTMDKKSKKVKFLEKKTKELLLEFGMTDIPEKTVKKLLYYVLRDFLGINDIEPLMHDPQIEDIECDGLNVPVYIVHKKFANLPTNIVFKDMTYLRKFVIKLAQKCGRYISYAEPILDGSLEDGSRVNATFSDDVTTHGPTFTIRKFSETPITPVHLVDWDSTSPEVMGYLWYCIGSGCSTMVIGGTGSGKTTLLNALSMFIKPASRIVTIEDTRELQLPHDNWLPAVARPGYGTPDASGHRYGEITMFDLLKAALRQRPDYIIVGEIRGEEAFIMFQAMASGHPSMGTFHAEDIDTMAKRLMTNPINLSPSLLEALDLVCFASAVKLEGTILRKLRNVWEITKVYENKSIDVNTVFEWDIKSDSFEFNDSHIMRRFAVESGNSLDEIQDDIDRRAIVILWMQQYSIKDYKVVGALIERYYKQPNEFFNLIMEEKTPDEVIEIMQIKSHKKNEKKKKKK